MAWVLCASKQAGYNAAYGMADYVNRYRTEMLTHDSVYQWQEALDF
jgi:hypothetical protein